MKPTTMDQTIVQPKRAAKRELREKTKRQPPYAVVLHNDHLNSFEYVIAVLKKVFGYSSAKAFWLTSKAHFLGSSQVWSGALEVAELKADQIRSCGPDPSMVARGALTLSVSVEALPNQ